VIFEKKIALLATEFRELLGINDMESDEIPGIHLKFVGWAILISTSKF
jgi:hypothetical protein